MLTCTLIGQAIIIYVSVNHVGGICQGVKDFQDMQRYPEGDEDYDHWIKNWDNNAISPQYAIRKGARITSIEIYKLADGKYVDFCYPTSDHNQHAWCVHSNGFTREKVYFKPPSFTCDAVAEQKDMLIVQFNMWEHGWFSTWQKRDDLYKYYLRMYYVSPTKRGKRQFVTIPSGILEHRLCPQIAISGHSSTEQSLIQYLSVPEENSVTYNMFANRIVTLKEGQKIDLTMYTYLMNTDYLCCYDYYIDRFGDLRWIDQGKGSYHRKNAGSRVFMNYGFLAKDSWKKRYMVKLHIKVMLNTVALLFSTASSCRDMVKYFHPTLEQWILFKNSRATLPPWSRRYSDRQPAMRIIQVIMTHKAIYQEGESVHINIEEYSGEIVCSAEHLNAPPKRITRGKILGGNIIEIAGIQITESGRYHCTSPVFDGMKRLVHVVRNHYIIVLPRQSKDITIYLTKEPLKEGNSFTDDYYRKDHMGRLYARSDRPVFISCVYRLCRRLDNFGEYKVSNLTHARLVHRASFMTEDGDWRVYVHSYEIQADDLFDVAIKQQIVCRHQYTPDRAVVHNEENVTNVIVSRRILYTVSRRPPILVRDTFITSDYVLTKRVYENTTHIKQYEHEEGPWIGEFISLHYESDCGLVRVQTVSEYNTSECELRSKVLTERENKQYVTTPEFQISQGMIATRNVFKCFFCLSAKKVRIALFNRENASLEFYSSSGTQKRIYTTSLKIGWFGTVNVGESVTMLWPIPEKQENFAFCSYKAHGDKRDTRIARGIRIERCSTKGWIKVTLTKIGPAESGLYQCFSRACSECAAHSLDRARLVSVIPKVRTELKYENQVPDEGDQVTLLVNQTVLVTCSARVAFHFRGTVQLSMTFETHFPSQSAYLELEHYSLAGKQITAGQEMLLFGSHIITAPPPKLYWDHMIVVCKLTVNNFKRDENDISVCDLDVTSRDRAVLHMFVELPPTFFPEHIHASDPMLEMMLKQSAAGDPQKALSSQNPHVYNSSSKTQDVSYTVFLGQPRGILKTWVVYQKKRFLGLTECQNGEQVNLSQTDVKNLRLPDQTHGRNFLKAQFTCPTTKRFVGLVSTIVNSGNLNRSLGINQKLVHCRLIDGFAHLNGLLHRSKECEEKADKLTIRPSYRIVRFVRSPESDILIPQPDARIPRNVVRPVTPLRQPILKVISWSGSERRAAHFRCEVQGYNPDLEGVLYVENIRTEQSSPRRFRLVAISKFRTIADHSFADLTWLEIEKNLRQFRVYCVVWVKKRGRKIRHSLQTLPLSDSADTYVSSPVGNLQLSPECPEPPHIQLKFSTFENADRVDAICKLASPVSQNLLKLYYVSSESTIGVCAFGRLDESTPPPHEIKCSVVSASDRNCTEYSESDDIGSPHYAIACFANKDGNTGVFHRQIQFTVTKLRPEDFNGFIFCETVNVTDFYGSLPRLVSELRQIKFRIAAQITDFSFDRTRQIWRCTTVAYPPIDTGSVRLLSASPQKLYEQLQYYYGQSVEKRNFTPVDPTLHPSANLTRLTEISGIFQTIHFEPSELLAGSLYTGTVNLQCNFEAKHRVLQTKIENPDITRSLTGRHPNVRLAGEEVTYFCNLPYSQEDPISTVVLARMAEDYWLRYDQAVITVQLMEQREKSWEPTNDANIKWRVREAWDNEDKLRVSVRRQSSEITVRIGLKSGREFDSGKYYCSAYTLKGTGISGDATIVVIKGQTREITFGRRLIGEKKLWFKLTRSVLAGELLHTRCVLWSTDPDNRIVTRVSIPLPTGNRYSNYTNGLFNHPHGILLATAELYESVQWRPQPPELRCHAESPGSSQMQALPSLSVVCKQPTLRWEPAGPSVYSRSTLLTCTASGGCEQAKVYWRWVAGPLPHLPLQGFTVNSSAFTEGNRLLLSRLPQAGAYVFSCVVSCRCGMQTFSRFIDVPFVLLCGEADEQKIREIEQLEDELVKAEKTPVEPVSEDQTYSEEHEEESVAKAIEAEESTEYQAEKGSFSRLEEPVDDIALRLKEAETEQVASGNALQHRNAVENLKLQNLPTVHGKRFFSGSKPIPKDGHYRQQQKVGTKAGGEHELPDGYIFRKNKDSSSYLIGGDEEFRTIKSLSYWNQLRKMTPMKRNRRKPGNTETAALDTSLSLAESHLLGRSMSGHADEDEWVKMFASLRQKKTIHSGRPHYPIKDFGKARSDGWISHPEDDVKYSPGDVRRLKERTVVTCSRGNCDQKKKQLSLCLDNAKLIVSPQFATVLCPVRTLCSSNTQPAVGITWFRTPSMTYLNWSEWEDIVQVSLLKNHIRLLSPRYRNRVFTYPPLKWKNAHTMDINMIKEGDYGFYGCRVTFGRLEPKSQASYLAREPLCIAQPQQPPTLKINYQRQKEFRQGASLSPRHIVELQCSAPAHQIFCEELDIISKGYRLIQTRLTSFLTIQTEQSIQKIHLDDLVKTPAILLFKTDPTGRRLLVKKWRFFQPPEYSKIRVTCKAVPELIKPAFDLPVYWTQLNENFHRLFDKSIHTESSTVSLRLFPTSPELEIIPQLTGESRGHIGMVTILAGRVLTCNVRSVNLTYPEFIIFPILAACVNRTRKLLEVCAKNWVDYSRMPISWKTIRQPGTVQVLIPGGVRSLGYYQAKCIPLGLNITKSFILKVTVASVKTEFCWDILISCLILGVIVMFGAFVCKSLLCRRSYPMTTSTDDGPERIGLLTVRVEGVPHIPQI
ncbi:unnamed protein product [Calicophoron daubneyi]|uniref:Ig-like domain-containing protein n=1 Tax=Calicophoron daubneyi TaxID=300641 RepID=A0AAV2TQN7_CALDB